VGKSGERGRVSGYRVEGEMEAGEGKTPDDDLRDSPVSGVGAREWEVRLRVSCGCSWVLIAGFCGILGFWRDESDPDCDVGLAWPRDVASIVASGEVRSSPEANAFRVAETSHEGGDLWVPPVYRHYVNKKPIRCVAPPSKSSI